MTAYDDAVLADSPLVYLPLADSVGSTEAANLGSLTSVPWTFSDDAVLEQTPVIGAGTSVSNAGLNQANIVSASLPQPTSVPAYSLEFWADMGSADQLAYTALLWAIQPATPAFAATQLVMFEPGVGPGRKMDLFPVDGSIADIPTGDIGPGPNHYVATINAAGLYVFYLDGVSVGTFDNAPTVGPFDLNWPGGSGYLTVTEFGGRAGSSGVNPTPDCRFSHFAIYPSALSPDRVTAHYAAGSGPTTPSARANGRTQVVVIQRVTGSAASHGVGRARVFPVVTAQAGTDLRSVGGLVLTMALPAVVDGRPTVPAHWAHLSHSFTAAEGAKHIHAIADPNPIWNPYTGGWFSPPPPVKKAWAARWSVNDLPDPSHYSNGYYWLGAPSSSDGTGSIQAAARQWNPDPSSSRGTPAWHSAFPFKPSVTVVNHYLQGGGVVHHPKGVNFNSHFIEHMWMTLGSSIPQPYTWVIAGMVASWPSANYIHTILDAGLSPAALGVQLSANDCETAHRLRDGQSNRSMMQVSAHEMRMLAHPGGKLLRTRVTTHVRPCMFIGIYHGNSSYIGMYAPGSKVLRKGPLNTDTSQNYILGRQTGWLDQNRASHLLMFEMRLFESALTTGELDLQYAQLASTHQFNAYRSM